ncbi:hypothetical protein A5736_02090 [Mycobacterium sp. SP-6446]|nr:hypothetical protein A5736_02090 [Mycobacterium sp. SP-6446]
MGVLRDRARRTAPAANLLDLLDQTTFDLDRVTGFTTVLQCFWVYDRPVDIDGLRQFHHHLQRGRLSRCIERSPLRFGRHRWIACDGSSDLEIATSARPREEFDAWLNEQANAPLNCEHGPGWHLAMVPFTDGGAGVSFVIPHCLADGVGLCEALADATCGGEDPMSWPTAASRRRWQALREDIRQTARDIPAIGRGVAAAVRMARRSRSRPGAATPLPALPSGADEPIMLPSATVFVDASEWEARAQSLGGTTNSLLVGLAGRLAQRLGRVAADGSALVGIPVNERVADDTRANAYSVCAITVDPVPASTDLRPIRGAIKQALTCDQEKRDDWRAAMSVAPLMGLLPKRLLSRGSGAGIAINSSSLGVVNPAANRPDGTHADYFAMRIQYPGMTRGMVHRFGGVQWFVSGRAHGHIFVAATAYQPGRLDSNDGLRQELLGAMDDFSLTGIHLGAPPNCVPSEESLHQINDATA